MSFNGRICICGMVCVGSLWAQSPETPSQSASGLDVSAIDKSADPCRNFYQYACGTWIKDNPIPPDESSWSRFNELHQRNQVTLRGILEQAAKSQNSSPIDQKIGGFYASCMNEPEIEQRGDKPLSSELERISHVTNQAELLDEVARLQQRQISVFFEFGPTPDLKNASMMIAGIDQGGLGLPEKDYYLRTDPKSVELRKKYVAMIAKIFSLIGVRGPKQRRRPPLSCRSKPISQRPRSM